MTETMDPLLRRLSQFAAFRAVPPDALQASLPLWKVEQLKRGKQLWKQGRPAESLAFVAAGKFSVRVNGVEISEVHAPELIGESAIFLSGSTRTASLEATEPAQVVVLTTEGLRRLRAEASPVYTHLLEHALSTVVRRSHALDRQISQVRQGNFAAPPVREPAGVLTRLWQRLRPQAEPALPGCPPLDELLVRQPGLADTDPALRAALVRAFTARSFRRGEVLVKEDTVDARAFVLAAGTVDALRIVEERGAALLLARFEPGSMFGLSALVEDGPRTGSVVATSDGWSYHIHRDTHGALPDPVRVVWMEAMLAVLSAQNHRASLTLQMAIQAFATHDPDSMPSVILDPQLGSAWGSLAGSRPDDAVARLRVHQPARRRG